MPVICSQEVNKHDLNLNLNLSNIILVDKNGLRKLNSYYGTCNIEQNGRLEWQYLISLKFKVIFLITTIAVDKSTPIIQLSRGGISHMKDSIGRRPLIDWFRVAKLSYFGVVEYVYGYKSLKTVWDSSQLYQSPQVRCPSDDLLVNSFPNLRVVANQAQNRTRTFAVGVDVRCILVCRVGWWRAG